MSHSTDIIVAGAGPAGLAAALLLHSAGYRVTLIAPPAPRSDERTSALLGGSIALLERTGVWSQASAAAAPLRSLRIVDATARLIRAPEVVFHAHEIGLEAFGYNLPNRALVEALEKAAGDITRIPFTVEDVALDDDAIAARLSTGETIEARLIVAADGRRSVIRGRAGIGTREWRYDQSALVLNFRHSLSHHDTSTEFHTEHGPFTIVPLPGKRSSLVWVDRPAETERRMALTDALLAAEIEVRSSAILGAVEIEGPRQAFPLSGMNVTRFAADRVVLVGEAAHVFPPIGAQGLNLGYRDVAALGDLLSGPLADPGHPRHLAAYENARRGDVLTRTAAVDALNRTLLNGFLPVQAIRGFGLFLIDRVPALRRAVMRQGVAS